MTCNLWYRLVRSTEALLPNPAGDFVRAQVLEPHSEHCLECRRYLHRMDRLNRVLRTALLGQPAPLPLFEPKSVRLPKFTAALQLAGALLALGAVVIVVFGNGRPEPGRAADTRFQHVASGSRPAGREPAAPDQHRSGTYVPEDKTDLASGIHLPTPHAQRRLKGSELALRERPESARPAPRRRPGAGQAYLDGRDPALASWRMTGNERDSLARGWMARWLPDYRDAFVRPEPALLADADGAGGPVGDALKRQEREAAVVDERLFTRVTLHLKATPLDTVCEELSQQTGVKLTASADVRDENATLFLEHRPAREVMRELARLFGYFWSRTGTEGHYRYELVADLRSRLAEQEMRSRDANAALATLDDTLASYRPYLDQSPEQLRARAKQASGLEKQRLDFAAENWASLNAYQRLTQADRVSLANGSKILFIRGASNPFRSMPDAWYQSIRSQVDGQLSAGAGGQGAQPYLSLRMDRSEMGQIGLHVGMGGAVENGPDGAPSWGGTEDGMPLATGIAPSVAHPNNAVSNRSLEKAPAFSRTISLEAIPSCPWFAPDAPKRQPGPAEPHFDANVLTGRPEPPHVASGDVWEAIHRATGLDVVADAYTQYYPASRFKMKDVTVFDALCRVGDDLGVRWKKDGGVLLGRSTSYFWNKLKEVPAHSLARWRRDSQTNHGLPLADFLEMAGLADEQLTSQISGEVIEHCWGIEEWGVLGSGQFRFGVAPSEIRPYARALALLTPAQLQQAQSTSGLTFQSLNARQQEMLARAILKRWRGPEVLPGLRFRFDYVPSGAYIWAPQNPDQASEFVGKQPLVVAHSREEALAAASRLSPTVQAGDIQRSRGGFSIHVEQGNGETWTLSNLGEGGI